jgi:hypothetical protein
MKIISFFAVAIALMFASVANAHQLNQQPVAFVVQSPDDANAPAQELCSAAGYTGWVTKRFAGGSEVAVICFMR